MDSHCPRVTTATDAADDAGRRRAGRAASFGKSKAGITTVELFESGYATVDTTGLRQAQEGQCSVACCYA
jgi:hypothetical protein